MTSVQILDKSVCFSLTANDVGKDIISVFCPVGWGCILLVLLPTSGTRSPLNKCPEYDTKQTDGEVPNVVGVLGMIPNGLLPSRLGLYTTRATSQQWGEISTQRVSWVWHETNWWWGSKCSWCTWNDSQWLIAQSSGAVDYTCYFPAVGRDLHSTSVLSMTRNKLMVRFQM